MVSDYSQCNNKLQKNTALQEHPAYSRQMPAELHKEEQKQSDTVYLLGMIYFLFRKHQPMPSSGAGFWMGSLSSSVLVETVSRHWEEHGLTTSLYIGPQQQMDTDIRTTVCRDSISLDCSLCIHLLTEKGSLLLLEISCAQVPFFIEMAPLLSS